MNNNPHTELDRLITALKNHLTAVTNRNGEHDPAIDEAYVEIANAFETYENALFEEHNEVTPSPSTEMTTTKTSKNSSPTMTTPSPRRRHRLRINPQ